MLFRIATATALICIAGCDVPSGNTSTNALVPLAARHHNTGSAICRGARVGKGIGWPSAIAVDTRGNVFVADTAHERVEEVSPPFSAPSFGKMRAIASGFSNLVAIAVDARENLYVVDAGKGLVEQISPAGHLTQVGPRFSHPDAVAVGGQNVYVTEAGQRNVTQISPPFTGGVFGKVRLFISDSLPKDASSLAVDSQGNLHLAYSSNTFEIYYTNNGAAGFIMPTDNGPYDLSYIAIDWIDAKRNTDYLLDSVGDSIDAWSIAYNGWENRPVCSGLTLPSGIAVDKAHIYYSDFAGVHAIAR